MSAREDCLKALRFLYIAAEESIADDVNARVQAFITEQQQQLSERDALIAQLRQQLAEVQQDSLPPCTCEVPHSDGHYDYCEFQRWWEARRSNTVHRAVADALAAAMEQIDRLSQLTGASFEQQNYQATDIARAAREAYRKATQT